MTFAKRTMTASLTLGQRFQQLREETGLSVEAVAAKLHIAAKYVRAIEDGRYVDIPGLVYARQFVRLYADYLGLQADTAMERFDHEYRVVSKTSRLPRPLPPARVSTEHPWLRRHFRFVLASLIVAVVLAYISWQAYRLFTPPRLLVTEPPTDITTSQNQIRVSGQTEPNVTVAINDQAVAVNASGQFSESVDVSAGLNTLRITAAKKHSQPRVITRQVLVEQ